MKKFIFLVFAAFFSMSLFYYDAYSKSSGNRKVIKTIVINKNAHGSATVEVLLEDFRNNTKSAAVVPDNVTFDEIYDAYMIRKQELGI